MQRRSVVLLLTLISVPAWDAEPRVVSESSNGATVKLVSGSTLAIELPAQPGTGYTWQSDPSPLLSVEKKPTQSSDSLAGGWETQRFEVTAREVGSTDLTLRYRQPWTAQSSSEKTFHIRVEVSDSKVH